MTSALRRWWRRRSGAAATWPHLDEGWVWPRRLDPDTQTAVVDDATAVGTTGSGVLAVIDDHGTVQLSGRPWTLEWWVGAGDRWHRAGSEINVRQRRLGPGPVTETAMKVPGGDIVQRVGGGEADGPVVVVEVENRSGVAVALAVVVRPFALDGPGESFVIGMHGPTATVDDHAGFVLDRLPAAVSGGRRTDDLAGRLAEGATDPPTDFEQRCVDGSATMAAIVPLAHTAVVRLVVGTADPGVFARLPTIEQIASGWTGHLDGGARIELPDPVDETARDLATVLLTAADLDQRPLGAQRWTLSDQARVLEALVRRGHPSASIEVGRWLAAAGVPARHGPAAALVVRQAASEPHPGWFDDYLGWAVDSVERGLRRADPDARRTAAPLATLLARSGQRDAASDLSRQWQPPPASAWQARHSVVDPLVAAARLVDGVDRVALDRPDGVDLLRTVPPSWLGQPVDVRDVPTAHGRVSFSVRWHGARPALLWEREPWPDSAPWRLRCPGLDDAWMSTDDRGEALLGRPESPGSVEPGRSFG